MQTPVAERVPLQPQPDLRVREYLAGHPAVLDGGRVHLLVDDQGNIEVSGIAAPFRNRELDMDQPQIWAGKVGRNPKTAAPNSAA